MFDEIFKRWVDSNTITQDDVVPILLEYSTIFNERLIKPEELMMFLQHPIVQSHLGIIINNALKLLGIKKGYHWAEILDQNGRFIRRIWQPQNGLIQN